MTREEAIERLKQNKAAAKFYAGMVQNTNAIENELKDIEAMNMAIEALKTQSKWIPCSERMPEEREWIGTEKFGTTISDEVYVTFESPDGERFVKHLRFQNGMLSGYMLDQINAFHKGSVPIAWMPLPEPYRENGDTE